MSKSKPKVYGRKDWNDDEPDYYYVDAKEQKQRRREKRMKNLIRSKNVDRLMEMDDDEYAD
jgi:hypothetical protein